MIKFVEAIESLADHFSWADTGNFTVMFPVAQPKDEPELVSFEEAYNAILEAELDRAFLFS